MAVDYLQYIRSARADEPLSSGARFLVSGADAMVRQTVGQHIVASCHARSKTLFVVDNTRSAADLSCGLAGYPVYDALTDGVDLCSDFFEVGSLEQISRLRTLLNDLGFDGTRAMKVVSYLTFVRETERRLGNPGPLNAGTLEEYGGTELVRWKLEQLMDRGVLSRRNYEYLLGRYAEVSGSAADFESFLLLFSPFLGTFSPCGNMAVHLPVGRFSSDPSMQRMMCHLLLSHISAHPDTSATLILDDGKGDRAHLIDIAADIPASAEIHMLTNDAFSLGDDERSILMNTFPVRIYTRHEDMGSCEKIEGCCGQIDVIRHSSSVAVDRRIRASSAWDMLLGTNRTDVSVKNAPSKEFRFRKESIHALRPGTGIVDCGGSPVLFAF